MTASERLGFVVALVALADRHAEAIVDVLSVAVIVGYVVAGIVWVLL